MKVVVKNIEWDLEDDNFDNEDVDLPNEIEINIPLDVDTNNEEEISDFLENEISNITGFCHTGFEFDYIN